MYSDVQKVIHTDNLFPIYLVYLQVHVLGQRMMSFLHTSKI